MRGPPTANLHIARLDLDLRGVPKATAEAAVAQLGPALARALAQCTLSLSPAPRLDAGRIATSAKPDASSLAAQIAQRIAYKTTRG